MSADVSVKYGSQKSTANADDIETFAITAKRAKSRSTVTLDRNEAEFVYIELGRLLKVNSRPREMTFTTEE